MLTAADGDEDIGKITSCLPRLQIQRCLFYSPSVLNGTISTVEQSTDNR